jgi:NarL family two-component system response regulator YdfI
VIRVALVAPALAVRLGLQVLLSSSDAVEVVAEAASLAEISPLPPETDVLLLASEALPASLAESAPLPVLLLVSGEPPDLPQLAELSARPWGLLPLEASAEELLAALNALHEGLFVSPPALIQQLVSNPALEAQPLAGRLDDLPAGELTERESEVLGLLAQGLANKQIAARLGISEHTVKFHVSAIYSKLGASSRTEAVRLGVRQGRIVL